MIDPVLEFDAAAYGEACEEYRAAFYEAMPPFIDLWSKAEAVGYKRGFAAAVERMTRAAIELRDEPLPLRIEGPKEPVAPGAVLVAPAAPPVAKNAPKLRNTRTPAAPSPREMQATASTPHAATSAAADSPPIRHAPVPSSPRGPIYTRHEPAPIRWTAERDALVEKGYPTEPNIQTLLKAVNQLPGELVTMDRLKDRASKTLGLRRPLYEPPDQEAPLAEAVPPSEARGSVLSPPKDVGLPAPRADGFVYASFDAISAWAKAAGARFDGSNVDRLNLMRKYRGLPPVVVDWTTLPETSD